MLRRLRWLVPIACSPLGCAVDDRTPGVVAPPGENMGTESGVNAASAPNLPRRVLGSGGAGTQSAPVCPEGACARAPSAGSSLENEYNLAFVTSQRYTVAELPAPGDAANRECARVAAAAGLPGSRFVAWLASPGSSAGAADEISPSGSFQHRGGWVRSDGLPVARSLASLTRGELLHPVLLDENGVAQTSAGTAWTAVSTAGTLATESTRGALSCRSWASSAASDSGGIALSNSTYLGQGLTGLCSGSNKLLCFGDDSDAELPAVPLTGRLAFLSRAYFNTSTGLAGADAICQSEACAAGLTGSNDCAASPGSTRIFKAYLHTSARAAWERFDLSGPSWQRPDGTAWLREAGDLAADAKDRLTGLVVRADGSYALQGEVWVGNQRGDNCRDWTSTSNEDRAPTTAAEVVDAKGLGAATSATQCPYNRAGLLCLQQ
jgi:hypothetical protein